jgi:hypothetical protein
LTASSLPTLHGSPEPVHLDADADATVNAIGPGTPVKMPAKAPAAPLGDDPGLTRPDLSPAPIRASVAPKPGEPLAARPSRHHVAAAWDN